MTATPRPHIDQTLNRRRMDRRNFTSGIRNPGAASGENNETESEGLADG